MEPEKVPLDKEKTSTNDPFFRFHVSFRGCKMFPSLPTFWPQGSPKRWWLCRSDASNNDVLLRSLLGHWVATVARPRYRSSCSPGRSHLGDSKDSGEDGGDMSGKWNEVMVYHIHPLTIGTIHPSIHLWKPRMVYKTFMILIWFGWYIPFWGVVQKNT